MESENNLFVVDTAPSKDQSDGDLIQSLFPLFSSSKFSLLTSEKPENEQNYFGK
jgi:hypothetical protein